MDYRKIVPAVALTLSVALQMGAAKAELLNNAVHGQLIACDSCSMHQHEGKDGKLAHEHADKHEHKDGDKHHDEHDGHEHKDGDKHDAHHDGHDHHEHDGHEHKDGDKHE